MSHLNLHPAPEGHAADQHVGDAAEHLWGRDGWERYLSARIRVWPREGGGPPLVQQIFTQAANPRPLLTRQPSLRYTA